MKKAILRGTGQLGGVVSIYAEFELEDKVAYSLYGQFRDDVKLDLLRTKYPGVKIDPRQISCEIIEKPIEKIKKSKTNTKKKPTTILSIITWILFLPFKLAWKILVAIIKNPHV